MKDRHDCDRRHAGEFDLSAALIALLALVFSTTGSAAEVSAQQINVSVNNPGFIVSDGSRTGVVMDLPGDMESASTIGTFGGPVLTAESIVESKLSSNAVGIGGRWTGISFPGTGTLRSATAGGLVRVDDLITVNSSVLAPGTAVQVSFRFFSAHTETFVHTDGTIQQNNSGVSHKFSANIKYPLNSGNNVFVSNGDNRFQRNLANLNPFDNGVFNQANPQIDVLFNTFVGGIISLIFSLDAVIGGSVWSTGVGNVNVQSGAGAGSVAIAFGATATTASVNLTSALFAGGYPAASLAALPAASSALPITAIPIPPIVYLFAASAGALLRQRRTARSLTRGIDSI